VRRLTSEELAVRCRWRVTLVTGVFGRAATPGEAQARRELEAEYAAVRKRL
jgi:hypothetical protein